MTAQHIADAAFGALGRQGQAPVVPELPEKAGAYSPV
jgi:hypothetical protein